MFHVTSTLHVSSHNIPCSFLWLHPSLTVWPHPPYCWAHSSFATTLRPACIFHTSRVNILVSFGFSWINVEAGQDGWKYVTVTGAVIDPILCHAMQRTCFDQASIFEEISMYMYMIVFVCVCTWLQGPSTGILLSWRRSFLLSSSSLSYWPGLVLLMEGLLQACGNQFVCVCVLSSVCRHCFKVLDDDAIKHAFKATSASEGVASWSSKPVPDCVIQAEERNIIWDKGHLHKRTCTAELWLSGHYLSLVPVACV